MMTDENGAVEVNYIYRAFGEQLKRLDDTGKETDDKAKYSYDGKELDDGKNPYVYLNNNPLAFVDLAELRFKQLPLN